LPRLRQQRIDLRDLAVDASHLSGHGSGDRCLAEPRDQFSARLRWLRLSGHNPVESALDLYVNGARARL
jgi:hypothetical protein